MPPDPSRRTILKPAKIAPSFNGMSAFSGMSGCPIGQSVSHCGVGVANRIGSGRGSVGCWLLALFGPVGVRVEAARVASWLRVVPVVRGVVASVAGGDDAAP